jgi:hypothetical protein
MKKLLSFTGLALLAAGMLILSGCPDKTEEEMSRGLVGKWDNQKRDIEHRTFTITEDGSFAATLNPAGGEGEGTVVGILVKEGNDYMMNNMREITDKDWGKAVGFYDRTLVQITLSNNDNVFRLDCADDPMVEQFFGGTYYRVE